MCLIAVFTPSMGSYCHSGGSCFTCCADLDFSENNIVFRPLRGTLLVISNCCAQIDSLRTTLTVSRLPRSTLLVMGAPSTVRISCVGSYCHSGGSCFTCRAGMDSSRISVTVFQASSWHTARDALHLPCRVGLPRTAVSVFRLPRGTPRVMGTTTKVQPTQAPSAFACTSLRTGATFFYPCGGCLSAVMGFSDGLAASGAVLAVVSFTVSNLRV